MVAKFIFRAFNFICGCLVFLILGAGASISLGMMLDPEEGRIEDFHGGEWSGFIGDSAKRGWVHIVDGFKS